MNIITIANGRELKGEEAKRIRIEASYGLKVAQHFSEQEREVERQRRRPMDVDDRPSIHRAMVAVEARIVEALWTLARLPGGGTGPGSCGIAYVQDAADRWANAVEKGWERAAPRPARPSPRAIDAMHEPLEWLSFLPKHQAMLISVAGGTKRGDVDRNISWSRVRKSLPAVADQSIRTLQHRYTGGIREIVARLTERAMIEKR